LRIDFDDGKRSRLRIRRDKELRSMSGRENAALWDADALDTEPWLAVRRIAIEALAELDQHPA
jgi:hypothetical protein